MIILLYREKPVNNFIFNIFNIILYTIDLFIANMIKKLKLKTSITTYSLKDINTIEKFLLVAKY